MKLCVGLICHYGVGGSARVAVDISRELAARGHAVHLIARSAPFGAAPPAGVVPHMLGERPLTTKLDTNWSGQDIADFTALVCEVIRRESLDLLHFHYAIPFVAIAQAVRDELGPAAPRMVLTLHGTDVSVFGRRASTRAAIARGLGAFDAVTTVSCSHATLASGLFVADSIRVVPNFVNVETYRPTAPHNDRPRVAYVSNFRRIKRPEAMARIVDAALDVVDAEAWLVGDGERMPVVEAVLSDRLAEGRVRKLGVRLDLDRILPDIDVLLVTSQTESFGLAALEAMASGVPVVAPRVGGLPELVEHGRSGLLFRPGDESGAVQCLTRLLSQRTLCRQMGARARQRALQFSSVSVIQRYEQLYHDVLEALPEPVAVPVRLPM
jgi:L-malate glycosyltransferase